LCKRLETSRPWGALYLLDKIPNFDSFGVVFPHFCPAPPCQISRLSGKRIAPAEAAGRKPHFWTTDRSSKRNTGSAHCCSLWTFARWRYQPAVFASAVWLTRLRYFIINNSIYPAVSKPSRTGNKVSCQPNDCPNRWVFKRRLKMDSGSAETMSACRQVVPDARCNSAEGAVADRS